MDLGEETCHLRLPTLSLLGGLGQPSQDHPLMATSFMLDTWFRESTQGTLMTPDRAETPAPILQVKKS